MLSPSNVPSERFMSAGKGLMRCQGKRKGMFTQSFYGVYWKQIRCAIPNTRVFQAGVLPMHAKKNSV